MSTKMTGTPSNRRTIIDLLLRAYKDAGIVADWQYETQARRWVLHMPNGTMLIYGPQQVEAFTQGVQAFAFRLNLSPLDPREPSIPPDEYDAMMREAQDETAHSDHGDGNDEPPF